MASAKAVAWALTTLHELYPTRAIEKETGVAWEMALTGYTDHEVVAAVKAYTQAPGQRMFPTFAEFRAHLPQPPVPVIDVPGLVRKIEGMGHYNPHTGWIWPYVEDVRVKLGDAVAAAYGMVGSRLGADEETTRSIAFRDFSVELAAQVKRDARALAPPAPVTALPPNEMAEDVDVQSLVQDVAKKLSAGKTP